MAEMYKIKFKLEGLPRILTNGSQGSWRKVWREKNGWLARTFYEVARIRPRKPLVRAKLKLTRFSSVRPDRDNLTSSFKPIIDGLVRAGVLVDDREENIVELKVDWQKAPAKQGFIEVEIEECA